MPPKSQCLVFFHKYIFTFFTWHTKLVYTYMPAEPKRPQNQKRDFASKLQQMLIFLQKFDKWIWIIDLLGHHPHLIKTLIYNDVLLTRLNEIIPVRNHNIASWRRKISYLSSSLNKNRWNSLIFGSLIYFSKWRMVCRIHIKLMCIWQGYTFLKAPKEWLKNI